MITQEELLVRLNQLTLRYNLTWFDIKYDADKAINKINNFLGTKYPKISTVMTDPTKSYTTTTSKPMLDEDGEEQYDGAGELIEEATEYEIIPEEYFHSIIIPYIAAEILARDEEFTTIYNKYLLEMQEGLYDMFQKEFNRVPFEFRQNPDQGVFFSLDSQEGISQHNQRNLNVPTFKFRVNYFPNNNDIILPTAFTKDTNAYIYDKVATILFPDSTYFSTKYDKIYTFLGWTKSTTNATANYPAGTAATVIMRSDLNLFATWSSTPILTVESASSLFRVSISATYRNSMVSLTIPNEVNGLVPVTIPSQFVNNSDGTLPTEALDKLTQGITLPSTIRTLETNAFNRFRGNNINLNEGLVTIQTNAFANTPKLVEIIIPASVTTIQENAFPLVAGKRIVIKLRRLEINKPVWNGTTGWHPNCFAPTTLDGSNSYTVEFIWGYNG